MIIFMEKHTASILKVEERSGLGSEYVNTQKWPMPISGLAFESEMQKTMLEILSVKSKHATKCDPRIEERKKISLQVKSHNLRVSLSS
jgi:hypothetical protein